jgi:hypothetical protein
MVKTSPVIVGVMEKSVLKHDIKKEGLSRTVVEPTVTTELDHELPRVSDEFTAEEIELIQGASYMKAASEEVTRKTDTVPFADLKSMKEVKEFLYMSDLPNVRHDELKETIRDSEFINIRKAEHKEMADKATSDAELGRTRDVHDQVMKTEYGITKIEDAAGDETVIISEGLKDTVSDDKMRLTKEVYGQPTQTVQDDEQRDAIGKTGKSVSDFTFKESKDAIIIDDLKEISQEIRVGRKLKESEPLISDEKSETGITKLKESKDSVITGKLKGMSQEKILDSEVKVSESLPSDEKPEKEITKLEKSKDAEVTDDLKGTSQEKLLHRKIQESAPLTSDEKTDSKILKVTELKDAEIIGSLKETREGKSGDKFRESKPKISSDNLEANILKHTVKLSTEESRTDLEDTKGEEVKPGIITQPPSKVRDIQSEAKPVVTTPTLSRRGIGGSQRLSRDQRPPPLDVSHLMMSSEEGTDEDFNAVGYIVTEPGDEYAPKRHFQEESIYRINSSPDILAEPALRKASGRPVPTVQVTEDSRDTSVLEVSVQAKEQTPDKEIEKEVAQVPQAHTDISESIQPITTSGQAHIQLGIKSPEATKQMPAPSMPVEEVIEQPLITFDTVTELQTPTPVPVEEYEDEVRKHRPIFRIESDDSADQVLEDIEALIEKANRELASELERAGLKVSDADDESSEEEEEADPTVHIPECEPEVEGEVIRTKEPDPKQEKKLRRVERRFERMASETLEKEAAVEGSSTPEVKQRHEAEFERMVSQLSTEEVADCQREYSQLWDEGGLTPSDDWDSHDPDTPSGELEEDCATKSPPGTLV